jgi:hypothetical protein
MTFVIFDGIDGKILRSSPSLILLLGDGLPDGHCIGDADRQEVLCSDGVWRGADIPHPCENHPDTEAEWPSATSDRGLCQECWERLSAAMLWECLPIIEATP